MGNAGSMNQQTDPRGHHMPLKLPMPDPGELEERFALVLVRKNAFYFLAKMTAKSLKDVLNVYF